jgi:hypothetical protein
VDGSPEKTVGSWGEIFVPLAWAKKAWPFAYYAGFTWEEVKKKNWNHHKLD